MTQQEPEILRAKVAALVDGDWCVGCGGAKEAGVELCVHCRPVLSHQAHMLLLVSAAMGANRATTMATHEAARTAAVADCPGHRFSPFRGVCCEVCKQHFSAHEIHAMLAAKTL